MLELKNVRYWDGEGDKKFAIQVQKEVLKEVQWKNVKKQFAKEPVLNYNFIIYLKNLTIY